MIREKNQRLVLEHFRIAGANLQPVVRHRAKHHATPSYTSPTCTRCALSSLARRLASDLELLLHDLWAVVFGRIAHNFGFIDWGLAPPVRIRRAVRRALSAAFDEDVSLQCIFPRKALLAVAAGERLHGQVNSLVAFQIMIAVEGLGALIAFEGSVVLLLLAGMMAVHWPAHLMRWVLHVHASNKCHLVSWVVHIGHNWACHRWKIVAAIRWS